MADLALGAVNTLLGLIRDEALLLGGVRGDVQFIKDKMESMNSFLLHLARTTPPSGEHDEQVRTWMKQVRDLASDCSNCIDLYVQRRDPEIQRARGLRGCVWWLPWFLRAVVAQHRAANQLRELKIRARDVGERRMRYGVKVPKDQGGDGETASPAANGEIERAHLVKDSESELRSALAFSEPDILKECMERILRWLAAVANTREEREEGQEGSKCPQIMAIAAPDNEDGRDVAHEVCRRLPSPLQPGLQFEPQGWISIPKYVVLRGSWDLLCALLAELVHPGMPLSLEESAEWDKKEDTELAGMIADHLQVKGKRSLIVLEGFEHEYLWQGMKRALCAFGCASGSAVIVTTKYVEVAKELMWEYEEKPVIYSLVDFFHRRALMMVYGSNHNITEYNLEDGVRSMSDILHDIFKRCERHGFCMKMFLHSIYANSQRSKQELESLCRILVPDDPLETCAKKMLMFCYNRLPKDAKSCLLYLAIFDRGQEVRRSRLVERWVAEGLITAEDWPSSVHRAERCFDALVDRWFVSPGPASISTTGKVKSCVLQHHLVHKFVSEVARKERFVDSRLSHHLAWHFNIHSGLWLRRSNTIQEFLGMPPPSSQLHLVKVLDLESCTDLEKKKHQYLKNICNKMLLLKYLSLRRTNITHLPIEINKLQQLEVLDIRETKVDRYATREILLPKLKRLLAGAGTSNPTATTTAEETVTDAVKTPQKIDKMVYLEVLSQVEFSGSRDAANVKTIAKLWLLRKLGVVIYNKESHVVSLFGAISDMYECLQSLSIRIKQLPGTENTTPGYISTSSNMGIPDIINEAFKNSPKYLKSLSINGVTGTGLLLPLLLKGSDQLTKLTLANTLLDQNNVDAHLSKLSKLRCLRLRFNSYVGSMLTLKKDGFKNVEYLLVDSSNITGIIFEDGTAPKLEKIVCSFASMKTLSGLDYLRTLRELEFTGGNVPHQVREAIEAHPNYPVLKQSN